MSDFSLNKIFRYVLCLSCLLLMSLIVTPACAQSQSIKNMLKVKSATLLEIDSMRHPERQDRLKLFRAKKMIAKSDSILLIVDSLKSLGVDSLSVVADSLVVRSKELKKQAEAIQNVLVKKTNPALIPIVEDSLRQIEQTLSETKQSLQSEKKQVLDSVSSLETDTLTTDSIIQIAEVDSLAFLTAKDTLALEKDQKTSWIPNSSRSTWLALLIPGGGQIYNRKYWKLPIFYGGFAACTYALVWNNRMYHDYQSAYIDLMDGNESTNSYLDLFPANYKYDKEQLETVLKNRKDKYRRWRDMSIFAYIGVYFLSVVDAYVDAELSDFDITPDLSMHIEPAVLNSSNSLDGSTVGVSCKFTF